MKSFTFRRTMGKEWYQNAARQFMDEHGVTEIDPDEVAQWMIDKGLYNERPVTPVKRCKQELLRALRDEREIDPQGREVRMNHAVPITVKGETKTFWGPIYKLKPAHMRRSLAVRMRQIEATVLRHRIDTLSYNDNNEHGGQLPLFDYDLNLMIEEKEHPTEYPDAPPSHDDSDESSS